MVAGAASSVRGIASRLTVVVALAASLVVVPGATAAHASVPDPILVPFTGNHRVSATWGAPSGGYHSQPAIDVAMPVGTPIHAAGDGTVTEAINDRRHCDPSNYSNWVQGCIDAGYGNSGVRLAIRHPNGRTSSYLHLDSIASGIGVGTNVRGGQRIGTSGNTGISTGPHLHYSEHADGRLVDPGTWVACHGSTRRDYRNLQQVVGTNVRNDGYACSTMPDPSQPLRNGELARITGQDAVYAVSAGTRWHVPNPQELTALHADSYFSSQVRSVNRSTLEAVAQDRPTNYSLLQERGGAGVHLFSAGTRWSIPNPTELTAVRRDITSDDTIHRVPAGRLNATSFNSPRDGSLLQERGSDGVYLFAAGTRWHVRSPTELTAVRRDITSDDTVYRVPAPRLSTISANRPKEGSLLRERDSDVVYRIEDGRKRPVGTAASHPSAIRVPAGVLRNVADVPTPAPDPDPDPSGPGTPVSTDAACAGAPPGRFPDVRGSVHAGPVDCIAWWGVTTGYGDGSYRPAGSVTRAQMATFIANALEAMGVELAEPAPPFPDARGDVHEGAIRRLAATGIVSGYPDGSYRPGVAVTRAQMATFLVRAYEHLAEAPLADGSRVFPDIAGNAHETNIAKAGRAGLAGGDTSGNYRPDGEVSRAQMGSFLARLLALAVNEGHAEAR